ncbi:MAG TPA: histidine kinase dimerization/phospho-acceptor domain-containing protein [Planctomycetota bacterium]
MRSIRADLTARISLLVGVAFLVFSGAVYLLFRGAVYGEFDAALIARAELLATHMTLEEDGVELDFPEHLLAEYQETEEPIYFEVWLKDREVLQRSPLLGERDLHCELGSAGEVRMCNARLPDGRSGRSVAMLVPLHEEYENDEGIDVRAPEPSEFLHVVVAVSSEQLLASMRASLLQQLLVTALLISVASLVAAGGVRRGLRPLARLEQRLGEIGANQLHVRLPVEEQPHELQAVSDRLNKLLERLESAFGRERRMTANIAHELRTPIAEIRSAAEVADRWPDDPKLAAEAVKTARESALHLQRLVDAILRLSKLESGNAQLSHRPCDLRACIREAWESTGTVAKERRLRFVDEGARVDLTADRQLLAILVRNLVENAVHHAAEGGPVRSLVEVSAEAVTWSLENEASELRQEELAQLPEPFWRSESSRTGSAHFGLGLALCEAIARVMGLRIAFELDKGWIRVQVVFPCDPELQTSLD